MWLQRAQPEVRAADYITIRRFPKGCVWQPSQASTEVKSGWRGSRELLWCSNIAPRQMCLLLGSLFLEETAERWTCCHLEWLFLWWNWPANTGNALRCFPNLVSFLEVENLVSLSTFPFDYCAFQRPSVQLYPAQSNLGTGPKEDSHGVYKDSSSWNWCLFPLPLFPHMPTTWIWNALFI